ncbi:uncharacterized protein LOC111626032 [Centruroides sculpturatus]|uniref:uncharacterized protein LOC111626032 n=1 Tax=Centruroides sculpturatus TaxID=218467 RepID=UPI000C6DF392|nr:uncharacterized protein LOC111625993 isoform X1 [Centruroides sculpturatus]XP_023225077.1 uncharacterized protein LOC111626032 [Centruroides sculpturatus]
MNPYLEPSVLFAIVMAVLVINACSPFLTVVSTVLFSILNVIIFLLFDYISSTYGELAPLKLFLEISLSNSLLWIMELILFMENRYFLLYKRNFGGCNFVHLMLLFIQVNVFAFVLYWSSNIIEDLTLPKA